MSVLTAQSRPMVEGAIDLARRRLPVFPLTSPISLPAGGYVCSCGTTRCESPAKHPVARLAPRGLKDATTDEGRIRHWWSIAQAANIGMATGLVIALDVDPRHGGDESLAGLERKHGPLPVTWRVLTGGGGEHIYFAAGGIEIRNSAGRLGPGLDVRGVGGYVVAPPSTHISGRPYAWSVDHHPDEVPLAPMPNWLVALLAEPKPDRRGEVVSEWRRLVAKGAQDGSRNSSVSKLTGHLLRRYVDPLVTLELIQAWNSARCTPPLSEVEVTRTVNSIAGREFKRREAMNARRR